MQNEILDTLNDMMEQELYFDIIKLISNFLDSNPQYRDGNYISFSNSLEKAIYEKYFGSLDEANHIEFKLHELYLYQSISWLKLGESNLAKEILKTAKKINPVSPLILLYLSHIYSQDTEELDEFKTLIDDLFKYNYYHDILIENYSNLANYYAYRDDLNLFLNISNFASKLSSEEIDEELDANLIFLNNSNIQIGYNPEIIKITKELYEESIITDSQRFEFLDSIYKSLFTFNSYYKGLSLDVNLYRIIEEVKISIVNNEIDEAIFKIKTFLSEDKLDSSINYKIFNNEIERELYYRDPKFDYNFILLPKHKNYYYLYYLYGFCLEKQEKYSDACRCYQKSLEFNPYSIFVNLALINLKLDHHIPTKLSELVFLADICYTKDDLIKVYECYIRFLKTHKRWDDVDEVDMFINYLKIDDYKNLNTNTIKMLKKDGFNILFNNDIKIFLEEIIELYSEKELDNLDLYKKYLEDITDLNDNLELILNDGANLGETGVLKDFSDEELMGSYILIQDKFDDKYYPRIESLKLDFNEKEFNLSDSFVCYAYRQATGAIAFLFLSVSSNNDELIIYNREFFYDVILSKNHLIDKKITFLNELAQFKHYIDESDNYSKWIGRNLSGDKNIDREFLLNELKNVDDGPFNMKKDAIGNKLKEIIDLKELVKKEIPCNDLIENVKKLIANQEYKHGLVLIDEFLEKYPQLYFDGYMDKYFYFTDLERELYVEYYPISKNIIRLHESQNYCEIYNLKAEILIELSKYDDAIDCLENSLKLNPLNIKSEILMSDAFYKTGYIEYAINSLKKVLIFNSDVDIHVEIYKKLSDIYSDLCENKLSQALFKLSEIFETSNFEEIIDKNLIINEGILIGFNPEVICENEKLIKINEKLFDGTLIDNILQLTKPLIGKWENVASEKLKMFIADNRIFEGYKIPYEKFEMSLMYGDESEGDKFYNFENNIDYEIFTRLNPEAEELQLISSNTRVCELLNTYAYSLKYLQAGKSNTILQESIKLNPINSKTLLYFTEIYLKLASKSEIWLDKVKPYFDTLFSVCWDKKILIKAYENLSIYYRYRGLKDTSKAIKEFSESLKNETFENKEYVELFKKHNIPLGFDENIIEIISDVDVEIYREMLRLNDLFFK